MPTTPARITDDSGFTVIYSKDSPHSGSVYEFWLTRADAKGQKVFTKMIFGDAVRHQAGYLAFMSLDGAFTSPNVWYSSHNFDQLLLLVGNDYHTLALGVAYPRIIG